MDGANPLQKVSGSSRLPALGPADRRPSVMIEMIFLMEGVFAEIFTTTGGGAGATKAPTSLS